MLTNEFLHGEKVYLSAVTRDDIPVLGQWFNNLDLLYNLFAFNVYPLTEEDEKDWYEGLLKSKEVTFAIRTKDTNQLIGTTGIKSPSWHNRSSEFGIAIGDPDFWGKGYGTDATQVILRYGFLEMNLRRIELLVYSYNARAIRSYEKIGFVHEGTRRQALFRDGQYHDIHIMALLRQEWEDVGQ